MGVSCPYGQVLLQVVAGQLGVQEKDWLLHVEVALTSVIAAKLLAKFMGGKSPLLVRELPPSC